MTIKDVYFSKMSDEINFWFFRENTKLYETIIDVNKPRIDGNKINLFPGFLHTTIKPFNQYSKKTQERVQLFLSYIREVLCSSNEEHYKYFLKWTADMCKGYKNDSCLYLKGPEGIGKSTFPDFLSEYVLGYKMTCPASSDVLLYRFNKSLCAMILAVFEELPTFSEREWSGATHNSRK